MKNLMIYSLALLFTTSLFTSCKKDGDDDAQGGGAHFSVMMDDNPFVAEDLYAYAVDFDTHINIYGVNSLNQEEVIYISVQKEVVAGTYNFETNPEAAFSLVSLDGHDYATFLEGGSGQVTIESFDGLNLKGTFSFIAVDYEDPAHTTVATEGAFNVSIR
ncbi:MAG: DUF6252 family protein [Chitinophagales bacterium]|nr:DUF6252 family protein [Chitinophagales bacterium]